MQGCDSLAHFYPLHAMLSVPAAACLQAAQAQDGSPPSAPPSPPTPMGGPMFFMSRPSFGPSLPLEGAIVGGVVGG